MEGGTNIYHERQRLQFCLLHSLNNLFQGKDVFTRAELNSIAEKLDIDDPNRGIWNPVSIVFKPHHNAITGNYDINVLIAALEQKGKTVVWHDRRNGASSIVLDDRLMGIVVNVPVRKFGDLWRSRHWVTLRFSYMACGFVGKKRRKEQRLLIALGTDDGTVLAVDISAEFIRWRKAGALSSGAAGLFFVDKGRKIHAVAANGLVFEMNSDTGEVIKEFKVSKKPFSSVAYSTDEKIIAAASDKLRFLSLESGKELLKFSPDSAAAQRLWLSDDAQFAVTAGLGEKQLQVWKLDFGERAADYGQVLSMKHPPIIVECRKNCKGEDGMVVLAISEKGVCNVWNFESVTDEVAKPIKITVKASKGETEKKTGRAKKNLAPIIAARLHALDRDAHLKALIAYGSVESPEFTSVDISSPEEDIVIAAVDQTKKVLAAVQENGHARKGADMEKEGAKLIQKSKVTNKRPASDLDVTPPVIITDDGNGEPIDGVQIDDLNEPTMGEKLARLHLADNNEDKSNEDLESPPQTKPPSADSVHVLLKQALHADDRALLIDCLYRQDEKVIANSVSLLNPSDVLKLLQSLLLIIQSRGAVLACALPWLRNLLLQHASGIMSQESSLLVLNSLYQLIDARLSTLHQALQLSSSLELLYAGTIDDGDEEDGAIQPIIFEDESDEEGSEVAMETESNPDVEEPEAFSDISDHELSDGMSE